MRRRQSSGRVYQLPDFWACPGALMNSPELLARRIGPGKLDIAYVAHGDPAQPTVLLIMGLGAQLVHWPPGFVDQLRGRQLHVVCFDNRDAGHSTHMTSSKPVDMAAIMRGDLGSVAYTLSDMAADAGALLDYLGIPSAHIVGASMGGAIAQTLAIEHPAKVRSLTSMMFTTGASDVGQPHPATMAQVFGGPPATTRDEIVARAVRVADVVGSAQFPADLQQVAATAGLAFDRGYGEAAIARQAAATMASGDRTERLRELDLPSLVVHGQCDTLCDPSGGAATAHAIAGAKLLLVQGMGHQLPAPLWSSIADAIADVVILGEKPR